MLEMDVDEDIYDFLPSVLRKYIIHYCRIFTSAKNFTDFLLTGGQDPVLYEVNGKNILSSVHLNDTIFKGNLFSKFIITFRGDFTWFSTQTI